MSIIAARAGEANPPFGDKALLRLAADMVLRRLLEVLGVKPALAIVEAESRLDEDVDG